MHQLEEEPAAPKKAKGSAGVQKKRRDGAAEVCHAAAAACFDGPISQFRPRFGALVLAVSMSCLQSAIYHSNDESGPCRVPATEY